MNSKAVESTPETSLIVIDVNDNDTQLILKCEFDENRRQISILLIGVDNCWKGSLVGDRSREEHTLNALRFGNKFGEYSYAFSFDKKNETVYEFVWKLKVIKEGREVLRKGIDKIEVEKGNRETESFNLLKNISVLLNEKNKILQEISKRNDELEASCEKAINELFNFAQQKETFVREIYSKFSAILNAKRERIKNLLENGHYFTNLAVTSKKSETSNKRKIASKSKKNTKPSPDDIYEQDTEPEMDCSAGVSNSRKKKIKEEV